jgi:hypothetical protein
MDGTRGGDGEVSEQSGSASEGFRRVCRESIATDQAIRLQCRGDERSTGAVLGLIVGRLSRKLCLKAASSSGLKAGLKHRIELREHLVDTLIGRSPFSIFKG